MVSVQPSSQTMLASLPATEDTLPKLLRRNALKYPKQPAMRKKRYGIWNTYTWRDYLENVRLLCLGLMKLGLQRGEHVAIIGDNDPEWWYAALATVAAGGVEYGIFVDCRPAEVEFFITSGDACIVFAKDQEQVDKMLEIRDQVPNVRHVIYWESKGMWAYDDPWVISLQHVQDLGRQHGIDHPSLFDESIDAGSGEDIYCLAFTSGTTGDPKPAAFTQRAQILRHFDHRFHVWRQGQDYFSFINPAWMADQTIGLCVVLFYAAVVNFPEGQKTLRNDAREIAATFQNAAPRVLEELARDVRVRLADANIIKRFTYKLMLPIGLRVADLLCENKEPGIALKALYKLADWLVFRPLRDKMGFGKATDLLVSGAAVSPGLLRYFRALGLSPVCVFGSAELGCISEEGKDGMRPGSNGRIRPGREVRLAKDGELVVKMDERSFSGYYAQPEATARAVEDGWFHTGDAVHIDDDGYLFFIDRVKELMALAGGAKFSASHIESMIRFSPYIKDVVVVGDGHEYVATMVNIDLVNVAKWADKRRLLYTTFVDLSQRKEVLDLVEEEIKQVNRTLPEHSRVRRFVNLHKELDPDDAEMTRTWKIKRGVLEARYRELIDAIYGNVAGVNVTTEVTLKDGRTAIVSTQVVVRDVH